MSIFKTVDAAGKTTFSDKGVGKQYTPGEPALGAVTAGLSMNPASATPFAEQVTTSYTPKPINSIGAARSQLTSFQNNLTASSNQMSQAAVSGIQPVTFDASKGGNITQAAGFESDFRMPELVQRPVRIEGQAAQITNLSDSRSFEGNPMGRYGGNVFTEGR